MKQLLICRFGFYHLNENIKYFDIPSGTQARPMGADL
jgi:hypothetical protein